MDAAAAVVRPSGPGQSADAIRAVVRRLLAEALYLDQAQLDDHAGFADLGLDSILAVELTKSLNDELGTDYRRRTLEHVKLYHTPLGPQADAEMDAAFTELAESHDEDPLLHIEKREIRARRKAGGVVWFDFKTLCGGPRSMNDYLEIASQFHTVMLSDVPHMPVNMASQARRFTWLVDVLYDRKVKLILSAEVEPEQLYTEGPLAHEFVRTVSRLHEMQTHAFMAQERRMVDTSLT